MNLTEVKYLLKKYNLKPRRENGQNFLINNQAVEDIVNAANLNKEDTVLEIGPGLGALTVELCRKAKKIVAVEQDKNFIKLLNNLKTVNRNLQIIQQDIFKVNLNDYFKDGGYKLVANLPFNISSLVLRNFLQYQPRPKEIILLLQKEVAERACARPGKMSVLSVATQFFSVAEIVSYVEKYSFYPAPEVNCAILKLKLKNQVELEGFFKFVKTGFSSRRKKLANNIQQGLKLGKKEVAEQLEKLKLDNNIRPQDLSVENWLKLFDQFYQICYNKNK